MKKNTQISPVWKYFDKVGGGGKCLTCNKEIACVNNTSNLMKHLRRLHADVYREMVTRRQENAENLEDQEYGEDEGTVRSSEPNDAVAETGSTVHAYHAFRDENGTTFLYLQPAAEGDQQNVLLNGSFQAAAAGSESTPTNGEVVPVVVQKDPSTNEGQAVGGEPRTSEESLRKYVNVPVKNFQGSSIPSRTAIRKVTRPSPISVAPARVCNSASVKEDSYDAFGKYIASMLRNLPSRNACKLQGEIVNWILKEQIKNDN